MFNMFKKKNIKENQELILPPKPNPEQLVTRRFYEINIIPKGNKPNITMFTKSEEIPEAFSDCLSWFAYRKAEGYILVYNKGFHALRRENIQDIHVSFEDRQIVES